MKSQLKVLIVDDNPDAIELVEEAIGDKYKCRTALYGEEAIRVAEKFLPDFILLDIMLPDISGIAVCKALRTNSKLEYTKIIFQSAKTDLLDRIKGIEAGADDYLCKPYDTTEVLELLERKWTVDLQRNQES